MSFKWQDAGKSFANYWLIPLLCALQAWRIGQDINWDLQNYHLYNAWAHLHDRYMIDLAPAGVQTFFNPLFDLLWYALVATLPPAAVGIVMGFLHGLNFVLVRAIARRVLSPTMTNAGWVSYGVAVAAILSVGFRSELGTAMHDNVVALLMLSSLLLCLRAQDADSPNPASTVLLAGLLAGFTCAAKLASAGYALALCVALLVTALVHEPNWRQRVRAPVMFSGGVIAALLLFGGYWYWFNWHHFGNPLFPLFNNIFHSELATPDSHHDDRFLPKTWTDWLLRPVLMGMEPTLASELPYRQYSTALVFIVALITLGVELFRLNRNDRIKQPPRQLLLLGVFAMASYCVWLKVFGIYRYLITLELLLPLLWLLLWQALLGQRRGTQVGLGLLLLLVVINFHGKPDWGHAPWSDRFFSVQMPASMQQTSTVLLMGQPLAWLVPAFDLAIPFLQIEPNFSSHGTDYDNELLRRVDRRGNINVIFDPKIYTDEQINRRLDEGHVTMTPSECEPLHAHLGQQELNYRYCRVKPAGQ